MAGQCLVVTLLTNNKEREQKIDQKKKKSEREKKETVMGSLIGWFAAFNVSLIILLTAPSFFPSVSNQTKSNQNSIEPNQTPIIRLGSVIEDN